MLTLTYQPEDAWHGELFAEAAQHGFSGKASAWFNVNDLRQFAGALRTHPVGEAILATIRGGLPAPNAPCDAHVQIAIKPLGTRGLLLVETALSETAGDGLSQSSLVRFQSEPAAIDRFAADVDAMLIAGGDAVLRAAR